MSRPSDRWDAVLPPPAGGLENLRHRIAVRERRRRVGRAAGAVAMVALLGLLAVLPLRPRPDLTVPATFEAIALGLVEAPEEPVVVPPDRRRDLAVLRVPTRDERVALYMVGTRRTDAPYP